MNPKILLTGATGYVGGRLLSALTAEHQSVRCLSRRPEALSSQIPPSSEVIPGDVFDPASLVRATAGIETAYYLIHSMGVESGFEALDRQGAENFADACRTAGVKRVIYLGGLSDENAALSPHLRSRNEVGEILRTRGVPTWEFRASVIIGSGSLSFEMIRALVERLPVMVTPRWVRTLAQPIAIEDVIAYLLEALRLPGTDSRVIEIAGPDQLSYGDLMREYARQRGLTRWMIPVPVLSPRLSSLWLGLVTPLYARVGRKLVESMRTPSVVHDPEGMKAFQVNPRGVQQAIARAIRYEDQEFAQTRWSDSLSSGGRPNQWGGQRFGNRLIDQRSVRLRCSIAEAFAPIQRIGGETGWYYGNFLWKWRGWLDLGVGGIGIRRGRRHPTQLRVGETLDFWRVEAYDPPRLLRLSAEMKLPGRAWLEFELSQEEDVTELRQTAIFDPLGLSGLVYWYLLYPVHQFVFAGMLRRIAQASIPRSS